jgi:hypothetical protein
MIREQWSTGLLQLSHIPNYAMAAVCPCQYFYQLSRIHAWSVHDNEDPMTSCLLGSLSVCVTAPVLICADQHMTRTIDGTLFNHNVSSASGENGGPSIFSSFMSWLGYSAESPQQQHWAHDDSGYDLRADDSENWWPLRMCAFYACDWLRAACCGCSGFGPNAPRMPMWLACFAGAAYPVAVCPFSFIMRRAIIADHLIAEDIHESLMITVCCLPCSIVQMHMEKHGAASNSGVVGRGRRGNDNDDEPAYGVGDDQV